MAGPWERYQRAQQPAPEVDTPTGPWAKYAAPVTPEPAAPAPEPQGRPGIGELLQGAFRMSPGGILSGASDAFNKMIESTAYGAGGKVTDALAGKVSPEIAAGAGYLANLGVQTAPVLLGGAIMNQPGKAAGRSLMQSAMKPTQGDLLTGKAARAGETLLKEGYNVSPGSMAAIRQRVGGLDKQIDSILSSSNAAVDKSAVADRLRPLIQKLEKQVTPSSDINAIQSAWTEFITHPLLNGKQIPAKLAHEIKKGTYQALTGKAYGEVGSASQEAQKALARGLREEIGAAVPQVVGPLAEQSALMNAFNVANRGAQIGRNKNVFGLGMLANNPVAGAGFALDRSQMFKSLLARGLYSGGQPLGQLAGARIGMSLGEPQYE